MCVSVCVQLCVTRIKQHLNWNIYLCLPWLNTVTPCMCVTHCVLFVGLLCMKRAVLQWAGQEQAGSVQLLPFLESNCRSWSNLAAAAGEARPADWSDKQCHARPTALDSADVLCVGTAVPAIWLCRPALP